MDSYTAITAETAAPPKFLKVDAVGQDWVNSSGLHVLPSSKIPYMQHAVMTPEVGPQLNLHYSNVQVRRPEAGEVVIKVLCTGVCRSVGSHSQSR